MSDQELLSKSQRRGLKAEFEYPVEPEDEPDDAEEDDEDEEYELRVALGEIARIEQEAAAFNQEAAGADP